MYKFGEIPSTTFVNEHYLMLIDQTICEKIALDHENAAKTRTITNNESPELSNDTLDVQNIDDSNANQNGLVPSDYTDDSAQPLETDEDAHSAHEMTPLPNDLGGETNADLKADSVNTRQTDTKGGIVNLLSPSGMNDNINEIN